MSAREKMPIKEERYVIASFGMRFIAALIDFSIFFGISYGLNLLLKETFEGIFPYVNGAPSQKSFFLLGATTALIAGLIVYVLPPLIFKNGKSLGKKIFKIRVIAKDGQPVTNFRMFFRFLVGFYAIEYVTGLFAQGIPFVIIISGIIAFINVHHQALHDFVSGTLVVDDAKKEVVVKEKKEKDRLDKAGHVRIR